MYYLISRIFISDYVSAGGIYILFGNHITALESAYSFDEKILAKLRSSMWIGEEDHCTLVVLIINICE